MKVRLKNLVTGAVLASSMIFSTGGSAMARDNRHYDRQALAAAQNQLNHDLQHKASRKKLAQDQAVIDQILNGNRHAERDNGWRRK
jgi:outer membrane murein-binding lipoprotein Lpp